MPADGIVRTDVLVIGGGPAGLCAGIEARRGGADALVVDDKAWAGGQLVKQTHMFFGSKAEMAGTRGIDIATQLIAEYRQAGGGLMLDTFVAGIYDDGTVGAVAGNRQFIRIHPKRIVVATGAYESMLHFPNCDLPGVCGAGGFQTLMNTEGVLPGRKVLMVGAGNIGLIVSYQLIQAGGDVAAIVEARPNVGGYAVHAAKIRRMGVPILLSHSIKSVGGNGRVEYATLVRLDSFKEIRGSEFTVEVDAVCLSVGLAPLVELLSVAGCELKYVPSLCGWVPWHDDDMRSSRPDIYVAGDASGIEEASSAMVTGRIAGCAAAASVAGRDCMGQLDGLRRQLAALRQGPFGAKIWQGKAELVGRTFTGGKLDPIHVPTEEELAFSSGKRVVLECFEQIPCNPCADACRKGAIKIEGDISNLPVYEPADCDGCKLCLVRCPGLAMFFVDMDYAGDQAEVTIVHELLPVPQAGQVWWALDRDGQFLCEAPITRVVSTKSFDRKHLVSLAVPKAMAFRARHITEPRKVRALRRLPPRDVADDTVVCRCEDVPLSEIERAIEAGHTTFEELKRVLRIGMGPCQGKTCQQIVLRLLSQKLHTSMGKLAPMKNRTPLRPVALEVMAEASTQEKPNGQ